MSSPKREKEKDFNKRRDAMVKEIQALTLKYRIDIAGALDIKQTGVLPLVGFFDVKDKYEHIEKAKKKKTTLQT